MKTFVGVTDYDWFRFLRVQPGIDEVNFWQPSAGRGFKYLQPGEPFLFKLHSPRNFIVGGGFFAHYSQLPHRLAWRLFGEKNGAGSLAEMEKRIVKYRKDVSDPRADFTIGCIELSSPFFFPDEEWIPAPRDWARNIVRGKGYELSGGIGAEIWAEVELRLRGHAVADRPAAAPTDLYGKPVLLRPRLGQGTFQTLILDTYERRCAVTGEKALPVLDAAHIRGVADGGQHLVENGLLLRTDVHRLFDAGYATVTPDYRFRVSERLRDEYDNGEPYFPFDGQEIWLPGRDENRPARQFLEWHQDVKFRG